MLRFPLALNVALVPLVLAVAIPSAVQAQKPGKSIWDGVYRSEQANRGQEVYDKVCANCHQDDLSGGGDEAAAILKGPDFFGRWKRGSMLELYRAVAEGMPKDAPGSLGPAKSTDVIAFLLKKNQVPAGSEELKSDRAALAQIQITEKP